ncbi:hypothetical protein GGI12_006278, partial [Dipsacomyces acuminosporus]
AKVQEYLAGKSQFTVRGVDYTSQDDLVNAFTGHDAVLSAIAGAALATQLDIIKAAEKAGVKYFLPSEFGSDITYPGIQDISLFNPKREAEKLLADSNLSYILITTGFFVDDFLIPLLGWDLKRNSVEIIGDGSVKNSYTSRSDIARYTIAVLKRAEEFKNKRLRFGAYSLSYSDFVGLIEKQAGSEIGVTNVTAEEAEQRYAQDKQETGGWKTISEQLRLTLTRGGAHLNWGSNELDNSKFPEVVPADIEVYIEQALDK